MIDVRFRVGGDVRYCSHHDMMRLMTRTLVRACWPMVYSQGFNPHPRISLCVPRPVGIASEDEHLLVRVGEDFTLTPAADRLAGQLPDGIDLLNVVQGRFKPSAAIYQLDLPVEQLERLGGKQIKGVAGLLELTIGGPSEALSWKAVVGGPAPRPADILTRLDLIPQKWLHHVVRMEILGRSDG